MALSEVEQLLFNGISKATHVERFRVHNNKLDLGVTDQRDLRTLWNANFEDIVLISMNVLSSNPGFAHLPWDLVGFGCQHLGNDRWRFMLRCAPIEFVFESRWPRTSDGQPALQRVEQLRAAS